MEVLKDENFRLKKKQTELETSVKQIATKLQRQMKSLNSDKVISGGKAGVSF
jgi:hypothetical protein